MHLKSLPFFPSDSSESNKEWSALFAELSSHLILVTRIGQELDQDKRDLTRTTDLPRIKRRGSEYARLVSLLEFNIGISELSMLYYLDRVESLIAALEAVVLANRDVDTDDDILNVPDNEELFKLTNLAATITLLAQSKTLLRSSRARQSESPFVKSIVAGRLKKTIREYFAVVKV